MTITLNDGPAECNIVSRQGDSWTRTFSVGITVDGDYTPWDLTGWNGAAQIRTKSADDDAAAEREALITLTVDVEDQSAHTGWYTVTLDKEDSVSVPTGKELHWDLEFTEPGDFRRTYMAGTWTFTAEETRV